MENFEVIFKVSNFCAFSVRVSGFIEKFLPHFLVVTMSIFQIQFS